MNKKVRKNLIAALIFIFVVSLGFLLDNVYAYIIATVIDALLILYIFYLINYQKNLNLGKNK